MPPRPIAAPPRRLTQQQLTYFMLGLPIGLIAVGVALAGLVVVWDSKQQWAVSQSDFAALWRRAVDHNPFIQAFMLNFGAIGVGYSIVRLLEHRAAVKAGEQQGQPRRSQRQQERRAAAAPAAAEGRKQQ